MEKSINNLENDLVEKYEEGLKQRETYWELNRYFKENYDFEIKTSIEKTMYLRLECLLENKYQVIVESLKYSPLLLNDECKVFDDLGKAKEYFEMLKNKYNGMRRKDAEKIRWDSRGIWWKIKRFFTDMLFGSWGEF